MLVVILNDGETYTDISGCKILSVPDNVKDVDAYVKEWAHIGADIGTILVGYVRRTAE